MALCDAQEDMEPSRAEIPPEAQTRPPSRPAAAQEGSPSIRRPMIEVGFWADPRDPGDDRPVPSTLVDKAWGETVSACAVALYVRSGFIESFELGYSFCRLGCSGGDLASPGNAAVVGRNRGSRSVGYGSDSTFMGCCTQTDGKYVWPEGLAHYISEHAVRPPEHFVRRAMGNLRALRAAQAGGRLMWDAEKGGEAVALAPGMATFLTDVTTLGIALCPEPELRDRAGSSGVCSCMPS